MTIDILSDSWGKSDVRLIRLFRTDVHPSTYELRDLDVTTTLRGDTADVYRNGDNAKVLSTDAQKNTVYAFAKEQSFDHIETFAMRLAGHFVASQQPVSHATVAIEQRSWQRVIINGAPTPHSFLGGGTDRRYARGEVSPTGRITCAGVRGLSLFNATGSEFRGFPRDTYTTGTDVADRILATELDAEWRYCDSDATLDFTDIFDSVRRILIETFATVFSKSIQYSMYSMAVAVFNAQESVAEIRMRVPNIHHYPVDLTPFGLTNDREVFVSSSAPASLIEATFRRADI
jgi:urate oxidase